MHTSSVVKGETALHVACQSGLADLTKSLLLKGANPNLQTLERADDVTRPSRQTPLHVAIEHRRRDVIQVFLNFKGWLLAFHINALFKTTRLVVKYN